MENEVKFFIVEKHGRWIFYNIETSKRCFSISKSANPKEKLIKNFGKEIIYLKRLWHSINFIS